MKILTIAPTPFFADRGSHVRILEEAYALEQRGHDVQIVTYHIGENIPDSFNTNDTKIRVHRIAPLLFWYRKLSAGPSWWKPLLDLQLLMRTLWLTLRWRPAVLHAHLYDGVVIGWMVRKLLFWRGIHVVADFHGGFTSEIQAHGMPGTKIVHGVLNSLERWIHTIGDSAVASSTANAERVNADRSRSVARTAVDGVRIERYADGTRNAQGARKHGLPDAPTIVYTGGFLKSKGIELLVKAIPIVHAAQPDAHFFFAGAPCADLEEALTAHSATRNTHIIDDASYDRLPMILHGATVAVDPKQDDTGQASGKILEYLAAGAPIVCLDRPTNRELAGEAALYATDNTPQALADAICTVITNDATRTQLTAHSATQAALHTWANGATTIEQTLI